MATEYSYKKGAVHSRTKRSETRPSGATERTGTLPAPDKKTVQSGLI
jgi:hypothetical protein